MNKKIKVIDLLVKIANGEIEDKRTFNLIFTNKLHRSIYYDKEEPNCLRQLKNVSDDEPIYDEIDFDTEVEILEDEEKIDIQELEDVNLFDNGQNFNDMPIIIKSYDDNFTNINNTINKLIQAVKRLDKKNK